MTTHQKLTTEERAALRCSFCGKHQGEVRKLVIASREASDVAICDECFICVAEITRGVSMTPTRRPQGRSGRGCDGPRPRFARIAADEPHSP
ncbi:MAG TPA: ClpX C4-type zinc finger protein [Actinomycetota bacterium]